MDVKTKSTLEDQEQYTGRTGAAIVKSCLRDGAHLRADACGGNAQPLDGTSIHEVLFDDLGSVFELHAASPALTFLTR
jgi:hypothetical protein